MNFNLINSLRGRYALVTASLSVLLLAGSFFAQYNLQQTRDTATVNIKARNQLLQYSRHVRTTLREHHEALMLFLLMPRQEYSTEFLTNHIEQAEKITDRFSQHPWIKNSPVAREIQSLRKALSNYDKAVRSLVELRRNADEQYPSMSIARNGMQQLHTDITNAISIALSTTKGNHKGRLNPGYFEFMEVRHRWSQIIAQFRIYMVNHIGSYDINSIPEQEQALDTLFNALAEDLGKLGKLKQQRQLDFEAEDSLETIKKQSKKWIALYHKVIKIHQSENWRKDVSVIQKYIEPVNEEIWSILQKIDIAIESSGNKDVANLSNAAERQVIVLWTLTILGLVALSLGYYFLEFLVLRPIADVSLALKHEALGDGEDDIVVHGNLSETRNLVSAFDEMRQQVHQRQEQLEHQALHDALTGLANRSLLFDRLQYAIRTSRRENKKIALLMIDLDRFKEVNDTLGHQVGDSLLIEIGNRLINTLREADTVARLGGDEFAVLLSNTEQVQAEHIVDKIHKAMETAFDIEGTKLFIKASIGIVLYPKHGKSAQALLQKADIAMYVAKKNKLGHTLYDPLQDQHSIGRLALMTDMRVALQKDQLDIYYQPKIKFKDNTLLGFEALLRWNHPKFGMIPPSQIIPLAEQTGDISLVTSWVITKSLKQLASWNKQDIHLTISVNLSVYNLYDSLLIEQITELLEQHPELCHRLTFEITESAMMEQPEKAVEVIELFDRLGVRISIDDFGTGFSSLAYLKRLPVDELKIDKSFVLEIHNDESDAVIVRSTIDLAHNLGLEVVAEGIENQDIFEILAILGCDHGQGFHIGAPRPIRELDTWIERSGNNPVV